MPNNLHLTLDERNTIEQELMKNTSFKDIALILDKDPTTIAKEVKNHRIRKDGQSIHVNFNQCSRKFNCKRRNVCGFTCNRECRKCNICNKVCNDFVEGICLRLKRAPYVCNCCSNRYNCRMTKIKVLIKKVKHVLNFYQYLYIILMKFNFAGII